MDCVIWYFVISAAVWSSVFFEACDCVSLCLIHKTDICISVYETDHGQPQLGGRWSVNASSVCCRHVTHGLLVSLGKKCICSVHNFVVSGKKFGSFSRTMVWYCCTTSSFFVPSGNFSWIS